MASATSSQGPSLWDNSDPGDALQLLQSEKDHEALEFTFRGEGQPVSWFCILEVDKLHFWTGYLSHRISSMHK